MKTATCLEHFFFGPQHLLSGVWHAPYQARTIQHVWIFCAPFGEEDKSARRTLNEGARWLSARGHAVLLFNARGAGDSGGDFAEQTLDNWREDIRSAIAEAKLRAPEAKLGLLGVRLGASLAAQIASEENAIWHCDLERVVLLEPILNGRRYWNEMAMRQKLRAKMTSHEANVETTNTLAATVKATVFDLDGWPIGDDLQADLQALNLENVRGWPEEARVRAFQIGAKSEVSNALKSWCEAREVPVSALVAQPFWNLLDHAPSEKLWAQIFTEEKSLAPVAVASTCTRRMPLQVLAMARAQ